MTPAPFRPYGVDPDSLLAVGFEPPGVPSPEIIDRARAFEIAEILAAPRQRAEPTRPELVAAAAIDLAARTLHRAAMAGGDVLERAGERLERRRERRHIAAELARRVVETDR